MNHITDTLKLQAKAKTYFKRLPDHSRFKLNLSKQWGIKAEVIKTFSFLAMQHESWFPYYDILIRVPLVSQPPVSCRLPGTFNMSKGWYSLGVSPSHSKAQRGRLEAKAQCLNSVDCACKIPKLTFKSTSGTYSFVCSLSLSDPHDFKSYDSCCTTVTEQ